MHMMELLFINALSLSSQTQPPGWYEQAQLQPRLWLHIKEPSSVHHLHKLHSKNTYAGMHSLHSMLLMISECNFCRDFYSKLNSRDLSREKSQQASVPMVIWKPGSSLNFQSLKCKGSSSLLQSPASQNLPVPPISEQPSVENSDSPAFSSISSNTKEISQERLKMLRLSRIQKGKGCYNMKR